MHSNFNPTTSARFASYGWHLPRYAFSKRMRAGQVAR